jgi:hypothetical protein
MRGKGDRPSRRVVGAFVLAAPAGCAPVGAYALVWWLGRRPGARSLAQSGLLFCSLTVTVALLVWWIFFSAF